MSRPRIYKTEGVVLRHLALGEADRILTIYTPDRGKVRAVAKGVRRTKSRLSGHLQLLNQVSLSVAEGRNLDVVAEAQVISSFRRLREDLERLSRAILIAELVDGFSVEQSANSALYRLLVDVLGWMETTDGQAQLLRYFDLRLLAHTGYRPELYRCVECRSELEPSDHLFSCARGGILCPRCRTMAREPLLPLPMGAMKVIRYIQREEYPSVSKLRVSPATLQEVGRVLQSYVRYILERDLKSVEFMDQVTSTTTRR